MFQMRTGKRIDLSELGVISLPGLVSQLSCIFKVWKRGDSHYVLYDSSILDSQLSKDMEGCEGLDNYLLSSVYLIIYYIIHIFMLIAEISYWYTFFFQAPVIHFTLKSEGHLVMTQYRD